MKKFIKILFISILVLSFFSILQGQTLRKLPQEYQRLKPDLAIETFTQNPTDYSWNFNLKNNGAKFIGRCRVFLVLNRLFPMPKKTVILDKSVLSTQFPYGWGSDLPVTGNGTYTLTLYVDYGNKIIESNESNNKKVIKFRLNERPPDFTIKKLRVPRGKLYFNYWIYNEGGKILQKFKIGFILDGKRNNIKFQSKYGSELAWGPIPQQTSFKAIFGFIPRRGQHTLTVIADPLKEIKESNENNNVSSVKFWVY